MNKARMQKLLQAQHDIAAMASLRQNASGAVGAMAGAEASPRMGVISASMLRKSSCFSRSASLASVFAASPWSRTISSYDRGLPCASRPPDQDPSVGVERGVFCVNSWCDLGGAGGVEAGAGTAGGGGGWGCAPLASVGIVMPGLSASSERGPKNSKGTSCWSHASTAWARSTTETTCSLSVKSSESMSDGPHEP